MSTAHYEPAGASAIGSAVEWLQGTLLGTVATTIAVIAVAWIGFMMLTGRIDVRRAARVIVGCFVIFGASTIAAGIRTAVTGPDATRQPELPQSHDPPAAPPAYTQAPASAYDPYAGAALPPSQ